jgi:SAM-dependent methyltransferase
MTNKFNEQISSFQDVREFINKNNDIFSGKLKNYYNYSRVVSLADFSCLVDKMGISSQEHVGVISGSELEPELKFLAANKMTFLNFSNNVIYDLDKNWDQQDSQDFSFAICNQVLEHVYNPRQALKNIIHHTRSGGYIYISIPTINCIHGEPYFYSAGYHPRFLERLAIEHKLEAIHIGQWGSEKYLINAVSGRWLTNNNLRIGIHGLADFLHPTFILRDGRKNSLDYRYITDCWALFKKAD